LAASISNNKFRLWKFFFLIFITAKSTD
jgi:hypothetical protein